MKVFKNIFKKREKEELSHLVIKNGKNEVRKYPKKTLLAQSMKLEKK